MNEDNLKEPGSVQEGEEQMTYDWPEDRFKELTQGQIIEAKVILVRDDAAFVDIGGKSDLTIPVEELSMDPNVTSAKSLVKVGDVLKVMVRRSGDEEKVQLSKRLVDQEAIWFQLDDAFKSGVPVNGTVTTVLKGGVRVDINGIGAFMPASQATLGFNKNLENLVGQTFPVKILEYDRSKRRVLVARRPLLEEERKKNEQAFFENIKEGDRKAGKVTRLADFGAFVDLGSGIEGLIHISELSWNRVKTPNEVLKEGDPVEVLVTKVDQTTKKISLSLKQIQAHPWHDAAAKFEAGKVYPGKVVRLETFGAFIRLAPGVDGLVHISQIADHRISKPGEVLSIDQEVEAKVLSIDTTNRKISLSLREVAQDQNKQEIDQFIETQKQDDSITQNLGELLKK